MATTNSAGGTSTRTAKEMQEWYSQNKDNIKNFANAQEAWKQLKDVTTTIQNKTINQKTKEDVIRYLQNPSRYEVDLRNTSNYLYYRSHIYMKLIDFMAGMVMPEARSVVPDYDYTKQIDSNKILKSYNETTKLLDIMNLKLYAKTFWTYCLKEDVYYGFYWLDDTGMTVIDIPADYGKIDGIYPTGNFSWAMDMSYFRNKVDYLDWWGEPVKSMYAEYERTKNKWQHVPEEHSVAFKFRVDDPDIVVPPFSGLFGKFADLEDMSDYEAIQAAQDIYKLVWMELPTISGSKNVDDFVVDPIMANKYFDKIVNNALPDYTAAAIVPGGQLHTIEFEDDAASQTSKYEKAMESILNTAGAGQVLCGSQITSTAAFEAAMIAAERFALTTLLPQFEGWIKMVLSYKLKNPCKVKFFMTSPYTKLRLQDALLTGAQNGMPNALAYNALNQISEIDTMSLNNLQEILGIPLIFKPLSTSYTQSGDGYTSEIGQGRPTKDAVDLSPDGDRSRNR